MKRKRKITSDDFVARGSAVVEAIILREDSPIYYIEEGKKVSLQRIEELAKSRIFATAHRHHIATTATSCFLGALLLAVITGTFSRADAIGVGGLGAALIGVGGILYLRHHDKTRGSLAQAEASAADSDERSLADLVVRDLESFYPKGQSWSR